MPEHTQKSELPGRDYKNHVRLVQTAMGKDIPYNFKALHIEVYNWHVPPNCVGQVIQLTET